MLYIGEEEFITEVSDYPISITRKEYKIEPEIETRGYITIIDIPFTPADIENLLMDDAKAIVIEIFKYSKCLYAGMKMLEIPMTKTLAKVFSKTNMKSNRTMTKRNFEIIKYAVDSNKFKSAGDPIKFTTDGSLGDGNHRINAIANSKESDEVEIPILQVLFGVNNEQLKYIDIGRSRVMKDRMQMLGSLHSLSYKANANIYRISSMAMTFVYYFYENGHSFLKARSNVNKDLIEPLDELMRSNAELCIESAKFGARHKEWGNSSVLAFSYFMILKYHPVVGKEFFDRMEDGVGLPLNSPVKYTTDKLSKNKMAGSISDEKKCHKIIHYTFQGFKEFKEGRFKQYYKWRKKETETRDIIVDCLSLEE